MKDNKPKVSRRVNRPPALGNTFTSPAVGQPVNPEPTGISVEAEVTIESETFTVNAKDLAKQVSLGKGHYGYVEKMLHLPTRRMFAVKHIPLSQHCTTKEQMKDLTIGMKSQSPYVTTYFCGLWYQQELMIVMELMDISLDSLLTRVVAANRSFPNSLLAYITYCVVNGLEHLHEALKVIHRDVKPSNILAKRQGIIKVSDFGIAGDLINSLAPTNLGSQSYVAPERIMPKGKQGFRIQSDVWSLGLTVFELATGQPCYPNVKGLFDQLDMVVNRDPPRLPNDAGYSDELCEFVAICLVKEEENRPSYIQLLDNRFLRNVDEVTDQNEMKKFLDDFLDPEL